MSVVEPSVPPSENSRSVTTEADDLAARASEHQGLGSDGASAGLGLLLRPKAIWPLLKATYSEWHRDNVLRMGAALAYYSIFSIAPLLIIAISIAGLAFGAQAAQGEITAQIQGLIGTQGAKAIETMLQSAHKPAHSVLASVIGVLALFLGASGVFSEMHDALNNIWRVDPDSNSGVWNLLKSRFLSFGMVLGIGFLFLVSLLLSAVSAALAKYVGGILPIPELLLHSIDFLFSLLSVTVLFALIFKILPKAEIAWSDVWVGSLLTSLLFTVGKFGIGFYIGKSALASAYGASGALVIVIAWIYYSALILYFGAEFTRVYATRVCARCDRNCRT